MKTNAKTAFLSTAIFLAVFGVAVTENWRAHGTAALAASDTKSRVKLLKEIQRREDFLAAAERERIRLEADLKRLRSADAESPSYDRALKIVAVAAKPWRDIAVERDAQLQALYLASERRSLAVRYGPFLRSLGLSAEQSGNFENAEMAAIERTLDIKTTALSKGLELNDPAIATLLQQSNEQRLAAQTALLGTDGCEQLQNYERTLPVRGFVNEMAGDLAFSDAPLTPQQGDQLVQLLVSANAGYLAGGVASPPRLSDDYMSLMASRSLAPQSTDWDSIQPRARALLSDTQFSVLNARIEENGTMVQLYNLMQLNFEAPVTGWVIGAKD